MSIIHFYLFSLVDKTITKNLKKLKKKKLKHWMARTIINFFSKKSKKIEKEKIQTNPGPRNKKRLKNQFRSNIKM